MENNAQTAFWINVYNALVMHVKDHMTSRLFCVYQCVTLYKVLLSWAGIFGIWDPPQLSEEVSLVSQGSALLYWCSTGHWWKANWYIVNLQCYHQKLRTFGSLSIWNSSNGLHSILKSCAQSPVCYVKNYVKFHWMITISSNSNKKCQ